MPVGFRKDLKYQKGRQSENVEDRRNEEYIVNERRANPENDGTYEPGEVPPLNLLAAALGAEKLDTALIDRVIQRIQNKLP